MILVFGTICLDRVRRLPHLPPLGGYVEVVSEQYMLGGEAANTACALRAWGADYLLAGNGLGSGPLADLLSHELADKGLQPVREHLIGGEATPVCDVFVTDDGERTMIGLGFSSMGVGVDVDRLPYRKGAWFTAEPNMREAAYAATRLAHKRGMRLYTMDFVDDDAPLFPGSFWQSSTDWAGTRGDIAANLEFVRSWVDRYGCFAILTDGSQGLVFGSPETPATYLPAYPNDNVVDPTGSGDIFRAGMLYGLDSGWEIERCLQFASAAGSLACRSLGATGTIPALTEIEALISS
ncbi:MAG TPA: carbohydrate kinase family protein [Fimbriimonadaceae bacterium]|nr:carbohydrate kinase family protein [Fimbriimonadaceae bacterium]